MLNEGGRIEAMNQIAQIDYIKNQMDEAYIKWNNSSMGDHVNWNNHVLLGQAYHNLERQYAALLAEMNQNKNEKTTHEIN